MTHLPALHRSPGRLGDRLRGSFLALACALGCVLVFAPVPPADAGTVLRGKVLLPAAMPARAGRGSRDTLNPAEVVVYVTEKPGNGKPRLAGRARREEIDLEGERFVPSVIAITARSKVRFENHDLVYHTLFSVSPTGRTEIGTLASGKRREVRFDSSGVHNLFCQLHPSSAGFVVVCPNWFHTRPNDAGEYLLPPLPRGEYIVHAWHPRLGEIRKSVDVTGHDIVHLDLSL